MKFLLSLSLYCLSVGTCLCQSPFFENLLTGTHPVGFKTTLHIDSSRSYGADPRPLLISLWYPASSNAGKSVTFGQYIDIATAKASLSPLSDSAINAGRQAFKEIILKRGASNEALNQLMNKVSLAHFESPQASQKLPLIISLQGGGRPAYTQLILNEYLASHGYLVASIADLREGPDRRQTTAEGNARALAADIAIIKEKLKALGNGKVAAMGFSKAGEAILLHQLLEAPFTAQVMMDAQPGPDADAYLNQPGSAPLETPTLAFFSNHQGRMTEAEAKVDSSAFSILNANRLKIRLMEANHGDLSSAAILGHLVKDYNRWPAFGNSALSYQLLCHLTKLFLDHYLKDINREAEVEKLLSSLEPGFVVSHKIMK